MGKELNCFRIDGGSQGGGNGGFRLLQLQVRQHAVVDDIAAGSDLHRCGKGIIGALHQLPEPRQQFKSQRRGLVLFLPERICDA